MGSYIVCSLLNRDQGDYRQDCKYRNDYNQGDEKSAHMGGEIHHHGTPAFYLGGFYDGYYNEDIFNIISRPNDFGIIDRMFSITDDITSN